MPRILLLSELRLVADVICLSGRFMSVKLDYFI